MPLEYDDLPFEAGTGAPRRRHYEKVIALNLSIGLLLLLGGFTDLSWAGTVPDSCSPPVAFFVAAFSLMRSDKGPEPRMRGLYKLSCMPSLLAGGAAMVLMIIPALAILPMLFSAGEIASEKLLQSVPSPDGTRVANVYFRPVGAYSGGNGRIFVRIQHRWLPLVERDFLYVRRSYADEHTSDYLEWKDNDTLSIHGEPDGPNPAYLKVGLVRLTTPW